MDLGDTGINVILVILIVVFLVGNIYFKKRKGDKTPLGMVVSIFSEVNGNQQIIEAFSFHRTSQKFRTGNWERNKDKIDFVPMELRNTLSRAFDMAREFNERIDAARKHGSDSYMAGIDVDKLKAPLAKSKQELQEWLQENMQNPEFAPPKRRGLFG